jgi:hypothetical protein
MTPMPDMPQRAAGNGRGTADLVCDDTAIDSDGAAGMTFEISRVVAIDGRNGVQMAILLYALTATNITLQLETSLDGYNWSPQGDSQTLTAIGRKVFAVDTVASKLARIKFSLTGTGKAIFKAWLMVSQQ